MPTCSPTAASQTHGRVFRQSANGTKANSSATVLQVSKGVHAASAIQATQGASRASGPDRIKLSA